VNVTIEPMQIEDVPEVSRVERLCFSNAWPQSAYRRELRNLNNNYYIVLRDHGSSTKGSERNGDERKGALNLLPFRRRSSESSSPAQIIGFAGMWILLDEAHITTIGVSPDYRGRGLGEMLLLNLFDEALRRGAEWVTLEVRVSNDSAQALYNKYGFTRQGIRRRYYSDNGEDAYIMWSPSLREPETIARLVALKAALDERMRGSNNGRIESTGG
jgi:[ribosomal protein S18]-alanine N-acetyltransferase